MPSESRWSPELLEELLTGAWVRRGSFGAGKVAWGRETASTGEL